MKWILRPYNGKFVVAMVDKTGDIIYQVIFDSDDFMTAFKFFKNKRSAR